MITNFPHWLQPQVTKKQVDNFREGKLTPCCQFKAEFFGRRKKIPTLKHQVSLNRAKYPNDVFTIDLPIEGKQLWLACTAKAGVYFHSTDPNAQAIHRRSPTFGDLTATGIGIRQWHSQQ